MTTQKLENFNLSLVHSSGCLLCVFALVLASGSCTALRTSVEDLLPVLVHLQFDNANLGRVKADVYGSAVGLFALNEFDEVRLDRKLLPELPCRPADLCSGLADSGLNCKLKM